MTYALQHRQPAYRLRTVKQLPPHLAIIEARGIPQKTLLTGHGVAPIINPWAINYPHLTLAYSQVLNRQTL